MPCQVDDDGPRVGYYVAKANEATQLLCGVMNYVKPELRSQMLCEVPGLLDWWRTHEAEDRVRREVEATRKAQEQRRQAALKKLTKEERLLLGLR